MYASLLFATTLSLTLQGCPASNPPAANVETPQPTIVPSASPSATEIATALPSKSDMLQQSWNAYRQRFIEPDGRVIDREADDRSTSEGQAYAMLRAVIIDDRATFDRTLQWGENNLRRYSNGKPTDSLWSWKWGRTSQGEWKALDANFASDGDIDAATALILAARRWNQPQYLSLAQTKLRDLWNLSTVASPVSRKRYLLPGPRQAFQKQNVVQINPSYFAPYAFRLFAQVDPAHDWSSLTESSYQVLQQAATLSSVGLPNDWVLLDLPTGKITPMLTANPGTSEYGFDAYRVWWRLALDASWFKEPRAKQYLQKYLGHPQALWRSQQKIPARIDLQGKPVVDYEATSQYAMLYAALQLIDPTTAQQIEKQKLMPQYRNGFWDNDSAYYTQNLVWFGLVPPSTIAPLLQPR
ncbi:MAG TPA: glycosyl hydrolase family 8 [Thermosynechococcaceae cyanobacterium]